MWDLALLQTHLRKHRATAKVNKMDVFRKPVRVTLFSWKALGSCCDGHRVDVKGGVGCLEHFSIHQFLTKLAVLSSLF